MNVPPMLELEEAIARILEAIPQPITETVSLMAAHHRVLVESVTAEIDLPCFDNSAMDGYAVRSSDAAQARGDSPVTLRMIGRVAAGESFSGSVLPGACVRIFTGSPLPQGADAVVMQEDTLTVPGQPEQIRVTESVKPWENVRFRAEDVKRGTLLARKGEILRAGTLSLLAAAGIDSVKVGKQPRIAVLATGSELREAGDALEPGQIYESNRVGLVALTRDAGGLARFFPLVPDNAESVRSALETAFDETDAVITSGGVSVGEMDLVKSALENAGGKVQFWRVAVKPGRPFVFCRYAGKLLFGLPGNPVSALVTFMLLVRPALLRWQGVADNSLAANPGVLREPLANPGQRRHFMRVKMDRQGNVSSAGIQASHILSSLESANGLVDVPPGTTLQPGTSVQVIRWD
jgi:molybdopterin molybdotransferase